MPGSTAFSKSPFISSSGRPCSRPRRPGKVIRLGFVFRWLANASMTQLSYLVDLKTLILTMSNALSYPVMTLTYAAPFLGMNINLILRHQVTTQASTMHCMI